MTNKSTNNAAGLASGGTTRVRARAIVTVGLSVAVLVGAAACKDSIVPNFRSPQVNASSPSGIQFLVSGVVAASRINIGQDVLALSSFAREMGVFTGTDQRFITEWMGNGTAIPNSDFYGAGGWANEFRAAKDAEFVIQQLPHVTPAYSASDASLITGVMKTFEAYDMMLVAETRDTNGVPISGFVAPTSAPAPILCIKDVWAGIAAMLDSAEADLNAGTPGPLPITLPSGFAAANLAGPSTTPGTFAGFNRALAAYAKLQYAYGASRSLGGAPPTGPPGNSAGSPLVSALMSADTAVKASSLYQPGALAPATAGNFADPLAVYHNYSGTSGDLTNPITFSVGQTTNVFVLDTVVAEFVGDLRSAKLIVNSTGPASPCVGCNDIATKHITVGFYQAASSPVPIIRNEELVLIEAMVQLGLGNFANAVTSINAVRTAVGGVAPYAGPMTYVAIRDQILHELRLSNIGEPGEERIMAVRNYGLQLQQTTTWPSPLTPTVLDTHATVLPIPISESGPRNGIITTSCP
jgi:starch-binding outer membrane protein, SusD/RagB family